MRIGIVTYEDPNQWILGKFARRLVEQLRVMELEAQLLRAPDPSFDINHHIIYQNYDDAASCAIDTLMITHIDTAGKLHLLRRQLETAKLGICMSRQATQQLTQAGIPADRLRYINPAHDELLAPRKISIGIFNKVHADGRTRNGLLPALAEQVDLRSFVFNIMGTNWEPTANALVARGIEVNCYPKFDLDEYRRLLPTLDYFMYLGLDEGSMAFVDALAAGVKTIATRQGFHLDATDGLTHPFIDLPELVTIFQSILAERNRPVEAVRRWTWRRYAEKHLALWQALIEHGSVGASRGEVDVDDVQIPVISAPAFNWLLLKGSLRNLVHRVRLQRSPRLGYRKMLGKLSRYAGRGSRSK